MDEDSFSALAGPAFLSGTTELAFSVSVTRISSLPVVFKRGSAVCVCIGYNIYIYIYILSIVCVCVEQLSSVDLHD